MLEQLQSKPTLVDDAKNVVSRLESATSSIAAGIQRRLAYWVIAIALISLSLIAGIATLVTWLTLLALRGDINVSTLAMVGVGALLFALAIVAALIFGGRHEKQAIESQIRSLKFTMDEIAFRRKQQVKSAAVSGIVNSAASFAAVSALGWASQKFRHRGVSGIIQRLRRGV